MSAIDTGGPAFPDPGRSQSFKAREKLTETGMTLRDYFAAKAMLPSIAYWSSGSETMTEMAKNAYAMADAMIAARKA